MTADIFRTRSAGRGEKVATSGEFLAPVDAALAGVVLAIVREEHYVFRATVLSFVLILAAGPSASLLCRTSCAPPAAVAGACHLERLAGSPSVGADESCDHSAISPAAVLQEHVWRADSSPGGGHATPVPLCKLAHSTIDVRSRHAPGRERSLAKRPLATVLRA